MKNVFTRKEINTQETLETVNTDDKIEAIKLTLNSDVFSTFEGVFDSGSSLNCIDMHHAYKYYRNKIRNIRDFYVRTANGDVIIKQYIKIKIKQGDKSYYAKWYLLKDSPYKFIISRALFIKLGYTILDPNGKPFINKARYEKLQADLYGNIFKPMDYPAQTKKTQAERDWDVLNFIDKVRTFKGDSIAQSLKENLIDGICAIKTNAEIKAENAADDEFIEGKTLDEILEQICGVIKSETTKKALYDLLDQTRNSYAKDAADIGTIPGEEFKIKLTKGATPFADKPYTNSYDHTDEIRKQTSDLLQADIIRISHSEWAAPVVMVPKPSREGKREWRMCVDYRGLNARTVKDKYRIPSMKDLYRKLRGSKIFSNIDLRSGYYHIPIAEEDKHKTAFITDDGLFEWNRMCFGFTNAPAVFQRAMDKIFKGLPFVVIYLDDVIICSENEQQHMNHLRIVFDRIREYNLKLRLIKCRFFKREIKYLGLIVNEHGVSGDPEYIRRILQLKQPENIKEVERLIGMVNWLGKFIPNLAKITAPLCAMKGKDKPGFIWTMEQERSFMALKDAVLKSKLLRHPDFDREFFVQTDASDHAIGAVLLQDFGNGFLEPIEFASRKFTDSEMHWHTVDKELVAVVWAMNKWIRYLLPRKFTVFTDHKNLQELFKHGKSKKNQRLHRWIVMLQQFDFEALYLPGKDNIVADYLSRDAATAEILDEMRSEMMIIQVDNAKANEENKLRDQICTLREAEYEDAHAILPIRKSARLANKAKLNYNLDNMFDLTNYGVKEKTNQHVQLLPEKDAKEQRELDKKIRGDTKRDKLW